MVLFSWDFTEKRFTQTLHFIEDFLKFIVYNPGCVREDRKERNQDTHVQTNFKTGSPHHDRFYHVRHIIMGIEHLIYNFIEYIMCYRERLQREKR